MNDTLDFLIPENHRRSISAGRELLDKILCRFEYWAKGGCLCGVIYREQNNLSDEQRRIILQEIENTRKIIIELRDTLELNVRISSVEAVIRVQSSFLWESLVELESKYLKRYGEFPKEFSAFLDPKINRLINHLNKIFETSV